MPREIVHWDFNGSFGITSTRVAGCSFVPASFLTEYILDQWLSFIEIHLICLSHGSSLDYRGALTPILCYSPPRSVADKRLVLCLFSSWVWFNIDSAYLCSADLPWHRGDALTPLAWRFWQAAGADVRKSFSKKICAYKPKNKWRGGD